MTLTLNWWLNEGNLTPWPKAQNYLAIFGQLLHKLGEFQLAHLVTLATSKTLVRLKNTKFVAKSFPN